MKKNTSIRNIFVLLCFLSLSTIYCQEKKQTKSTLFGQQIKNGYINPDNGFIRCASTEYENFLQENNSNRMTTAQFEAWIAPIIAKQKEDAENGRAPQTVFNIPVVIHVIHNGDPINTSASHAGENISYAQAVSQITVMNQDFRRMLGTPGNGSTGYNLGTDCEVNFCLAQRDPNGILSDGVHRVNLGQASFSTTEINNTVKPQTQWDPTKYLNMWTVRFTDGSLLGYAQFPSNSGLGGLNANGGNANSDGVVANYNAFGTNALNDGSFELNPTYNLGRTMTHEVGHWIGLRHIWGDDTVCTFPNATSGDYVTDTPDSDQPNYTCTVVSNCSGNDMIENYMDYTNDACMNTFTAGQKARMVAVMTNSPRRMELSASNGCTPGLVYSLDGSIENIDVVTTCSTSISPAITIKNQGTTTLTSMSITYSIDNVNPQVYNWTGSLAQNATAIITINGLTTTSGAHTFYATITGVNGAADQNATNNASTKTFTIVSNYAFNDVVFTLQKDNYGSETTWTLKNGSGATLYSGGPYTNQTGGGTLITQNWTLANNNCYTFTINDNFGDGICCTYGNGFYDIKNGATVVTSGASFGASESKSFSINLLGNTTFESSNDIYVYPNPTKGTLNIKVPNNFGLPNSYTVQNYLGQTLEQKNITAENDLSINTSSLSNGVYFITVVKGNEKKTLRFIKE
ncbi:M43 family zinc metalloprotease [Flavobacterium sp.]|uniref:M43 family zinc metalloprotease n=1 Tax=Flavobacterium sp. TaxID=239 RepID=UPI002B4B84E4|nr:M43 family zinc metalloprotease [Flavobacterium sp.]HLF51655.1 M43 family zinc metalloprotease [Flavobacterium sp.]